MRRAQWEIFNRWLKLVEMESLDCTPGLVDELIKRRRHYDRFSSYLINMKFKKVVSINNHQLTNAIVAIQGINSIYFLSSDVQT